MLFIPKRVRFVHSQSREGVCAAVEWAISTVQFMGDVIVDNCHHQHVGTDTASKSAYMQ